MDSLADASARALWMLITGDPDLWRIVGISFGVSLRAILLATPPALLLALLLAYGGLPGRRVLVGLFNALLALPTVVVGLLLYLLLSRSGPLGQWGLLFTRDAMVIGQIVLAFPILVAMGHSALQGADRRAWEAALTLGAAPWRAALTLMRQVRFALLAAVIAAFGRIISEVGCAMMVGGNILGYTRTITTAIALETSKGEFAQGIALGAVLMALALALNAGMTLAQGRGELAP